MTRPATTVRKYGKPIRKTTAEQLFAELPKSPVKKNEPDSLPRRKFESVLSGATPGGLEEEESVKAITQQLHSVTLIDDNDATHNHENTQPPTPSSLSSEFDHTITWSTICPHPTSKITKIAEASYAEVYRITNPLGTSIIKAIRLPSPIKPQTKAQQRSGLVDEDPHSETDLSGELQISEWLADVPGFVVYKERYVVQGKATKPLLETHQAFHRKLKRQDPDRLQFYPSPSRYLHDTKFLVVELGDAGTALEDFTLNDISQVWDIFLHTAITLARAEELIRFEHRDLHEGNLCIRQARPARPKPLDDDNSCQFGYSGLEITILDYGLSRASSPSSDYYDDTFASPDPGEEGTIVAYDLEKDLSLFTSTHALQCAVYRQMRSYLLMGDRPGRGRALPPESHTTPYKLDIVSGKPISWSEHHPYTNVLWLAYLYRFLLSHFSTCQSSPSHDGGGGKAAAAAAARADKTRRENDLNVFKAVTKELWTHLNPDAPRKIQSFPTAVDVVRYAVEAGWITEEQLMDSGGSSADRSRLSVFDTTDRHNSSYHCGNGDDGQREGNQNSVAGDDDSHLRRSPRRRTMVRRAAD
ncbi:hypothetical protein B0H66DRAFT_192154 [Apodospora peruviana]|uniref:non-specific serine/threonine protein kinase n=1 Tax=Apodospora peruviana TaxID=516989 RepID=A0AAE0IBM4_9PEZI|nr:hypothetical protein B0H66DRAFT_192154 [Apodospora peruviana]